MSFYRTTYEDEESALTLLRPEDARRLRAKAWRHLRRINAVKARKLWAKIRARESVRKAA